MGCLIEIALTSPQTVSCKPRIFTLDMCSCALGRLHSEFNPKETHVSCINTTQDFKAVVFFFFFSWGSQKTWGSSLTIAMYCKLIIKAGWRNQLPAVKNIYNCKYYISTVEQVNTALWKCLLYRSAHRKGERETIILQFSAVQRFADIENVFWGTDFCEQQQRDQLADEWMQ